MRCLLDTNVVSEATRPAPDPAVSAWLAAQPLAETHRSVVTVGEIERDVIAHDLVFVTRNVRDVKALPVETFDPWV